MERIAKEVFDGRLETTEGLQYLLQPNGFGILPNPNLDLQGCQYNIILLFLEPKYMRFTRRCQSVVKLRCAHRLRLSPGFTSNGDAIQSRTAPRTARIAKLNHSKLFCCHEDPREQHSIIIIHRIAFVFHATAS